MQIGSATAAAVKLENIAGLLIRSAVSIRLLRHVISTKLACSDTAYLVKISIFMCNIIFRFLSENDVSII